MNELTPYEQLIAAKLDQVPVPDMADAIWSSIDVELGAPASSSASVPALRRASTWYGLAAVVVVAALLYWHFSHHTSTVPTKALPERHAPSAVEPPFTDSPVSDKPGKMPVPPARIKKDTVSAHFPADSLRVDSAARPALPLLSPSPSPPMKPDSSALQKNRPDLPDVDLYGSPPSPLPRSKKPKGVKGIGEDDYKITATKDSTKKN